MSIGLPLIRPLARLSFLLHRVAVGWVLRWCLFSPVRTHLVSQPVAGGEGWPGVGGRWRGALPGGESPVVLVFGFVGGCGRWPSLWAGGSLGDGLREWRGAVRVRGCMVCGWLC